MLVLRMDNTIAKIHKQFGVEERPFDIFYSADQSLRFELGGGEFGTDRPLRRFAQAYERSNAVAQAFFENSPEVYVLLTSLDLEKPDKKRLKPLKRCGIKRSEVKHICKTPQHDDDHIADYGSDLFRHWDIVKLKDKRTISEILWLGIGLEIGVQPALRVDACLVDPENGLLLNLYDDRGMDVVAIHRAPLCDLFVRFNDWLLDYHRAYATEIFGGGE